MSGYSVSQAEHDKALWIGRFDAMASPCEVLVDGGDRSDAVRITRQAAEEAWRIERHWSRYRDDSIIHRINTANGQAIRVDPETADMLNYAQQLWSASSHRFDITSGVLRHAWRFDGSDRIPDASTVEALRNRIGWQHAKWATPWLQMPAGMELDFGGIGKEYAVDKAINLIDADPHPPVLLNFGGDLACSGPRASGDAWQVGVQARIGETVEHYAALSGGGLATSGDAHRFLLKDGVRYSHVMDATTGWPVPDAPRSVTVAASSCTLAGAMATLAMLQGAGAKDFLDAQGVRYILI